MRIGLLDHMGYGNLGDAATQDALILNIRQRLPRVEFVAFSLVPDDTEARHQIPCYPIKRWYPKRRTPAAPATGAAASSDAVPQVSRLKRFVRRIPLVGSAASFVRDLVDEIKHVTRSFHIVRSLDMLVFAGGGQFGELWKGPWAHPYNVFKFAVLAKLARVRLVIVNVGAGPLRHPLSRFFVGTAVRFAEYASFRDVESQQLVRSIGVRKPTFVFPDSVYSLEVPEPQAPRRDDRRPIVGLNPMGYADPRIWPKPSQARYSDFLDKLTAFCLWLLSQNYRLKVFTSDPSVDVYAIADLKTRLQRYLGSDAMVEIFGEASNEVGVLLENMSGFDYVVTSKFHGVVFAHVLAKPVIAISYHNKIDDLMRAAGDFAYCLDIDRFDAELLKHSFLSMVEHGPELRTNYRELSQARARALARQFDELWREGTGGEVRRAAGYRLGAEPDRP